MQKSLIEELEELYKGTKAYDRFNMQKFTLRAAYLWSVHNFLTYGIFSGWSIYGKLTWPIYGLNNVFSALLMVGRSSSFDYHICWLQPKHIFRG